MKIAINKQLAIILIFLAGTIGFAQDDTTDLESWNSVNINYKLNKKWEFGLEGQYRLKEDISEVSEYFGEINAQYSLFKGFKLGAGFRYIRENDNVGNVQGYENHIRYHFDASYKHKINDFSLKYRLRYQNKNQLNIDDYDNKNFRFKTSVEYNFKNWKLDPKLSGEIFYHTETGEEDGYNKYRLTLGTDYKLKKAGTIGVFYRIQKELNQTINETTNIIGLKYSYTFKNK